jgi:hypothetical protein
VESDENNNGLAGNDIGIGVVNVIANAGPDQIIECPSTPEVTVTLNGSHSFDPNADPLTYTWTWNIDGNAYAASGVYPVITLPAGRTTVTLTVNDPDGNTASDTVVITVGDTIAPSASASLIGTVGGDGWYTSEVTVILQAADGCSGVKEIHYILDNGAEQVIAADAGNFVIAQEGTHTVSYWAVDNAGNVGQGVLTQPINKVTPTPSPTPPPPPPDGGGNPGSSPYYPSCVFVSLQVTDGVTQYSIDGQTWQPYTGAFQICETTTVRYGNPEAPKTIIVNIDMTTPVTSMGEIAGETFNHEWYKSALVTLTATDNQNGSGVREIHYILDGTETVVAGNTATFTVTAEGLHDVIYFAKDNAGLAEAPHTVTLRIDTTPPVIAMTGVHDGDTYDLGSVPVPGFVPTDALSGVALAGPPSLTGGDVFSLGTFTFSVTATDNANNTTTATAVYTVTVRTIDSMRTMINRYVSSGDIDTQKANSLLTKLSNAQDAYAAGDDQRGDAIMLQFIQYVQNQADGHVSLAAAAVLIDAANYIITH